MQSNAMHISDPPDSDTGDPMMDWTDRADGTSSLDLPGDDWAVVQPAGRGAARGLWAFRLRRPPGQEAECVDHMGPFPFGEPERAKQAAERIWAIP